MDKTASVLAAVAALGLLVLGESALAALIGDYRFTPSSPLANEISDGLPDIRLNVFDPDDPPLLTGQEIPAGGDGAAANGWALGWTRMVPQVGYKGWTSAGCRIPADTGLRLGQRFSLWMRIIYGGKLRDGRGYTLASLDGPGGETALNWSTTATDELALTMRARSPRGEVAEYACDSAPARLLARYARWYDVAVTFDAGRVTFYATAISRAGPGPTRSRRAAPGSGLRLIDATGPLWILKNTNTAVERLRIYRDEVLSDRQVRALSSGVRLPGPQKTGRVTVGTDRQLFVDDAVIEQMSAGVTRQVHAATKYRGNPVVRRTQPEQVEGLGPVFWGTVLFDEQERVFKMWYQALTFHKPEIFNHLYAYSKDGIDWIKPKLDIIGPDNRFDPPGYPKKIGHAGMWLSVRKDPREPDPKKRYQGFIQHDPYYYCTSPDGLHWVDAGIAAHFTDDTTSAAYHPRRKEYLKIGRFCPDGRNLALRLIMTCVSKTPAADGNTPWHLVMLPDERDLDRDGDLQFYHMPAFAYENVYFSTLGVYHAGPKDGTSEHELAFSRDGLNWQRLAAGRPFIPRGSPGSWDSGFAVTPSGGPIAVGDELWFYYAAYRGPHQGPFGRGAIGLAKLRRDGFVSLHAGPDEGAVTTKPFALAGKRLKINAFVGPGGGLRVGILDALGQPFPGYALEDADVFSGDSCGHTVTWNGRADLTDLKGKRIKLRFQLRRADLYCFRVAP